MNFLKIVLPLSTFVLAMSPAFAQANTAADLNIMIQESKVIYATRLQ